MLDERPEIVVEVQHHETQAVLLQPLGQLDGGGGLARRAGPADPHHANLVAGIEARQNFGGGLIERSLVSGQRFLDQRFDPAAAHDLVQPGDGVAAALPVPFERLLHRRAWKAVPGEFIGRDRAFPQPMAAPPIAGVGIGSILEAITAQGMQHLVLDGLDRRREIGDQVMRIRIEANHDGVGEELSDLVVRAVGLEDLVIDVRQEILRKTADRFRRVEDRPADAVGIELHQRAVAFLDFDNAVLDGHGKRVLSLKFEI